MTEEKKASAVESAILIQKAVRVAMKEFTTRGGLSIEECATIACERLLASGEFVQKSELQKDTITLCGSTKFPDVFEEANRELTLRNFVVLSVGCYYHTFPKEREAVIETHKEQLDKLHKRKIERSFAIVVLNKGGYIGYSTKSEIDYAREHGKQIYWYEDTDNDYNRGENELNWRVLSQLDAVGKKTE